MSAEPEGLEEIIDLTILPRRGGGVAFSFGKEDALLLVACLAILNDSPVCWKAVLSRFPQGRAAHLAGRLRKLHDTIEAAMVPTKQVTG